MKWREWIARADRLQQGRVFKLAASAVVLVLAGVLLGSYVLWATPPAGRAAPVLQAPPELTEEEQKALTPEQRQALNRQREIVQTAQRTLENILAARQDTTSLAVGIGIAAALALVVVWLGLGLTYLALLVLAGVAVTPLALWGPTAGAGRVLAGAAVLWAVFLALLRALALLYSAPGPVWAIARNVLAEAVRMRIFLVFIVLMIFALAALPSLLDSQTPLRYRVQSFLQYGTGGAFWFIAVLTLLFSVWTVAMEQRTKTIWQTMTKPVRAWEYVLGKWLGLSGLAAVLLFVAASAVFLFTEYLRSQPAQGEREAYVAAGEQAVSRDRRVLEEQVLTARVSVPPSDVAYDEAKFQEQVELFIEDQRRANPDYARSPSRRQEIVEALRKQIVQQSRAIEPGGMREFAFENLGGALRESRPLIFRYRVDAGGNAPDQLYKLTIFFKTADPVVLEASPGQMHSESFLPVVVDPDTGSVQMQVFNGDYFAGVVNPESVSFPPGGLEMTYSVGGYRANFARVIGVLWVKLAFLAMVGIFASTFLSFSVASLVTAGTFLCAESAQSLSKALIVYDDMDTQGRVVAYKWVIVKIAQGIEGLFRVYGDLKPTLRLVDGRLLSWGDVAVGTLVLALWTAVLFAGAVFIFRRRELAIYSGK